MIFFQGIFADRKWIIIKTKQSKIDFFFSIFHLKILVDVYIEKFFAFL